MSNQAKFEAAKTAYLGFFRTLQLHKGPISAVQQAQVELLRGEMIAAYDVVKGAECRDCDTRRMSRD